MFHPIWVCLSLYGSTLFGILSLPFTPSGWLRICWRVRFFTYLSSLLLFSDMHKCFDIVNGAFCACDFVWKCPSIDVSNSYTYLYLSNLHSLRIRVQLGRLCDREEQCGTRGTERPFGRIFALLLPNVRRNGRKTGSQHKVGVSDRRNRRSRRRRARHVLVRRCHHERYVHHVFWRIRILVLDISSMCLRRESTDTSPYWETIYRPIWLPRRASLCSRSLSSKRFRTSFVPMGRRVGKRALYARRPSVGRPRCHFERCYSTNGKIRSGLWVRHCFILFVEQSDSERKGRQKNWVR